jgi:cytochrome P450 family 26 subfamily A
MDSMAKDHLEADWSPYKQVRVLPLSKKYTFALACRLFMNIKDPAHVSRLENHFNLVTNGLVSVPINFPGTTYYRAVKGGKIIREELLAIMKQRKGELASENYEERAEATDLLTLMLLASDDNGQPLNERDIAYKVLGLLVAGHDTTSSAITMVMYYLAEYPHIYQRVLEGKYP